MQTADEILIGANGSIHVAPVGTAAPADPTADYSGTWKELGFATEAGVKLHDGKTVYGVKVWQSFYVARRSVTEREFTLTFGLVQWNGDTVKLAFDGGEISSPSAGVFKYTPPDPSFLDERTLGIDWEDGDRNYRLIVPRGMVIEAVDAEITRTKESELPIVFGVTTDGTADPWYLLTDDPSFS